MLFIGTGIAISTGRKLGLFVAMSTLYFAILKASQQTNQCISEGILLHTYYCNSQNCQKHLRGQPATHDAHLL